MDESAHAGNATQSPSVVEIRPTKSATPPKNMRKGMKGSRRRLTSGAMRERLPKCHTRNGDIKIVAAKDALAASRIPARFGKNTSHFVIVGEKVRSPIVAKKES